MRCFVITKKQLMTSLSLTVAAVILIVGAVSSYAASERLLPIYCVETDKKQIAISFDAAWGNSKKVQNIQNISFLLLNDIY